MSKPAWCRACGKPWQAKTRLEPCPQCGAARGESSSRLPVAQPVSPPTPPPTPVQVAAAGPVQVAAENVYIQRVVPRRRGPLRMLPGGGPSSTGIVVAIILGAVIMIGGFIFWAESVRSGGALRRGPHTTTSLDRNQGVILFDRYRTYKICTVEGGIPVEIIESVMMGDARWYHIRCYGGEGWTQCVSDD